MQLTSVWLWFHLKHCQTLIHHVLLGVQQSQWTLCPPHGQQWHHSVPQCHSSTTTLENMNLNWQTQAFGVVILSDPLQFCQVKWDCPWQVIHHTIHANNAWWSHPTLCSFSDSHLQNTLSHVNSMRIAPSMHKKRTSWSSGSVSQCFYLGLQCHSHCDCEFWSSRVPCEAVLHRGK